MAHIVTAIGVVIAGMSEEDFIFYNPNHIQLQNILLISFIIDIFILFSSILECISVYRDIVFYSFY